MDDNKPVPTEDDPYDDVGPYRRMIHDILTGVDIDATSTITTPEDRAHWIGLARNIEEIRQQGQIVVFDYSMYETFDDDEEVTSSSAP